MYGDLVARVNSATHCAIPTIEIPFFVVSSSQQHTTNQSPNANGADVIDAATDVNDFPATQDDNPNSSEDDLARRNSLTVADLATLAASNNSTPVFRRHAAKTLRTELNADAVLIIDYVDAFGGKTVRAISGIESAVLDSDLWLPDWMSPVDVNSPIIMVDVDPSQFSAISAMGARMHYRSAIALAIPGKTGAAGMVIAFAQQPIGFDDSQIDSAKMVVSLLSLSASRSNALSVAERGESQFAASRLITRSTAVNSSDRGDQSEPDSLLAKISEHLRPFFGYDVIVLRVESGGEFTTQEVLGINQSHSFSVPNAGPISGSATHERPIESRASVFSVALTNATEHTHSKDRFRIEKAWKSVGIESVLVIPIVSSVPTVIVLGSMRFAAYTSEAVAVANRFIPALTAAFANGSSAPVEAVSHHERASSAPEYLESIASATELISACGVIATQIAKRTAASRVQIGLIDEGTGRAQRRFDTESSDDLFDHTWASPDEIERCTELNNDQSDEPRFSDIRTAIKVSNQIIGFVEVTCDGSGFNSSDISQIKDITLACSPVVATLRQLEISQATLDKLEMLRRVNEQIRSERAHSPVSSPRIASLIRNLFAADWIYFGSVDHENDHSTTEITDGLDISELAPGVRVSRRSLLIPSTLAVSGPVIVDLERQPLGNEPLEGGCTERVYGRLFARRST